MGESGFFPLYHTSVVLVTTLNRNMQAIIPPTMHQLIHTFTLLKTDLKKVTRIHRSNRNRVLGCVESLTSHCVVVNDGKKSSYSHNGAH